MNNTLTTMAMMLMILPLVFLGYLVMPIMPRMRPTRLHKTEKTSAQIANALLGLPGSDIFSRFIYFILVKYKLRQGRFCFCSTKSLFDTSFLRLLQIVRAVPHAGMPTFRRSTREGPRMVRNASKKSVTEGWMHQNKGHPTLSIESSLARLFSQDSMFPGQVARYRGGKGLATLSSFSSNFLSISKSVRRCSSS